MFLLNLDYLTELSKLGLKSKQGNLHFFTKFGPPQRKYSHISAKGVVGGWIKNKAVLLEVGSKSLSCCWFRWKLIFPSVLLLDMLSHAKPFEWWSHLYSHSFLVLLHIGIPTGSCAIQIWPLLRILWQFLPKATYLRCPKNNSLFDI